MSDNTDEKKLRISLKMAQEQLNEILGPEFYEQIESQYIAKTLSTDNKELYEGYIKDFLAWQTNMYHLKFANVHDTPIGMREFNEENSEVVSDIKMFSYEKNVRERVTAYKARMINYIKLQQAKDSTKFPLFGDCKKFKNSFAITSIGGHSNTIIRVNQSVTNNE